MGNTTRKWVWGRLAGAAVLLIAVFGMATIYAQGPSVPAASMMAAGEKTDSSAVRLMVGRSTVVDVGTPITRVSLTSSDIADAMVTSPSQLLVNGKMPGTISMFVWDKGGALRRYEVTVQRDLARLNEQVKELFPNEKIDVQSNGKNIILAGTVSNKDTLDKAINVASGYVGSKDEVVSLLQLAAGAPSNQVMLRVRFAEVSRTAMTELGLSMAANGAKDGRWFGRSTTEQFPSQQWDNEGKLVFSDFLNLFLLDSKNNLSAVLKALQTKGLFQSLAEPNLVAESGKEASFLAGGEIPIPVAQGSGANLAISVMFKEFGIRLNFTPTVTGDRVHLKVRPEVSTLDFANAVALNGFRIPALSTRRTETELELQNGQTFAIAGLMNNNVRSTLEKIPGIGNIPILGLLFTSKAAQKEQTELVVMITPIILPNNSPGVTPNLPRGPESYMPALPDNKTKALPPPAFGQGASAAPVAVPVAAAPEPTRTTPTPAAAAAAVSALTPSTRPTAKASTTATAAPARPLTDQEKKALERSRREEQERAKVQAKSDEKAKAEQVKAETARILEERHRAEDEKARKDKESKEQQKRDAEAARKAQEAARKQAEADQERQKSIDAAAERLKAAEAQYQAELAKKQQQ